MLHSVWLPMNGNRLVMADRSVGTVQSISEEKFVEKSGLYRRVWWSRCSLVEGDVCFGGELGITAATHLPYLLSWGKNCFVINSCWASVWTNLGLGSTIYFNLTIFLNPQTFQKNWNYIKTHRRYCVSL